MQTPLLGYAFHQTYPWLPRGTVISLEGQDMLPSVFLRDPVREGGQLYLGHSIPRSFAIEHGAYSLPSADTLQMRLLRCCQFSLAVFSIARCLALILVKDHTNQEENSQHLFSC